MIKHIKDTETIFFGGQQTKHASMKALVGQQEGWDSHVMRILTLEADGYSPLHKHPWPHINYVLEGEGEIEIDGKITAVEKGHYAYIEADKIHQFRNTSKTPFVFICIVPIKGHIY